MRINVRKLKISCTLLLLCHTLPAWSQVGSRWEAGPRASISYNYRSFTRLFKVPFIENNIISRNNHTDIPKITLNIGADVFYNISRNVSIGSGVFLNGKGFKTKKSPTCYPGPPPNCIGVFVSSLPGADMYKEKFHFYYTSFPLYLRIKKEFGKFGVSAAFGASMDVLTFYIVSITEYDKMGNSLRNTYTPFNQAFEFDRFIYSSYSDISFSFPFKETMRMYIGPVFRYSSPFITKDVIIHTNLYSISLEARLIKDACMCRKKD